jgi:hypothetical protein
VQREYSQKRSLDGALAASAIETTLFLLEIGELFSLRTAESLSFQVRTAKAGSHLNNLQTPIYYPRCARDFFYHLIGLD